MTNEKKQKEIQTKLSAARTQLILDNPFLGNLVLHLPLKDVTDSWCTSTATDAHNFYYNPDFIDSLSNKQTQFMLSHEALHCALSHFSRRLHRNKARWDIACDFAVNDILIKDGLIAPPGALHNAAFDGLTAEEIYPSIEENSEQETLDQHLYDQQNQDNGKDPTNTPDNSTSQNNPNDNNSESTQNMSNQPGTLSQTEKQSLEIEWQRRMASAAQQAELAGKLSQTMQRLIEKLLKPVTPWNQLLAQYMTSLAKQDYSYTRPSSRREGPAIHPSLRSKQINIVVALDSSGSVKDAEISQFISEINAIKGQLYARLSILACDSELSDTSPMIFEPWDEIPTLKMLKGGGTTEFSPVFNWVNQQDIAPDVLIYFTDGRAAFPKQEPHYPVFWLIKGKQETPWGTRIQLN